MRQEDTEKICADKQINTKWIYCSAATVCAACIYVLHERDAHKDLFVYIFTADTFALCTAVRGRQRSAWKARLYRESNRIPLGTWLSHEFISTGKGFSAMLLAEFPQVHLPVWAHVCNRPLSFGLFVMERLKFMC